MFHIGFLNRAQMDALHTAGHTFETFALTEVQKAVAVLKTTSIGATIAQDITTLKDHSMSGADKMATVVANTVPLVLSYLSAGGVKTAEADVLSLAKELAQSTFNDVASTSAGKVASDVLALFAKKA